MRITILQGAFLPVPPLRGGAVEKMWFELGKQFSQQGHSVCHISRRFPDLPSTQMIAGVQHIRVPGYDTPSNGIHLKLLDLLYSIRALRQLPDADILITNTFWMPILAGCRQQRLGRIFVDVQRMPKRQLRFYGRVEVVRANSRAVENEIVRQAPRLKNRILTIPNPLPFKPPPLATYERQQVILFCGRIHPEKGIALLIEAFMQACDRGLSGWTLRLVGPADIASGGGGHPWLEGLLDRPRAAGLPVEWLGPIYGEQELQSQYQQASIFVYPSLAERGETFGLAPLEAMAFGAVPIVSDLACFRDFISTGLNGLVFNHCASNAAAGLASKILLLAGDGAQRAAMSQAALLVSVSHDPAKIANDFLACFRKVLRPNPGQRLNI